VRRVVDLRAVVLRAVVLRAVVLRAVDFLAGLLRAVDFLAVLRDVFRAGMLYLLPSYWRRFLLVS
jgi:hypothetical protein